MQQGANSATPPAKKAASTEPVVSRSPIGLTAHCLRQSPFEFAPGEPAGAEVLPIQQDQGTHRRAVLILSLIHISEPTRRTPISYAVFCLKKKTHTPHNHPT